MPDSLQKMHMQDSRNPVIDMDPEKFMQLGHQLIDQIGDFLTGIRAVTPGESSEVFRIYYFFAGATGSSSQPPLNPALRSPVIM